MKIHGDPKKTETYGTPHPEATDVEGVVVVGYDTAIDKWLALRWTKQDTIWLVGGGREEEETFAESAVRELREETGYHTFTEQVQLGGLITSYYYNDKKQLHRRSNAYSYLFLLDSTTNGQQSLESHEDFSVVWMDYPTLVANLKETGGGVEHWLAVLERARQYIA